MSESAVHRAPGPASSGGGREKQVRRAWLGRHLAVRPQRSHSPPVSLRFLLWDASMCHALRVTRSCISSQCSAIIISSTDLVVLTVLPISYVRSVRARLRSRCFHLPCLGMHVSLPSPIIACVFGPPSPKMLGVPWQRAVCGPSTLVLGAQHGSHTAGFPRTCVK